jgi:hypothetical protein
MEKSMDKVKGKAQESSQSAEFPALSIFALNKVLVNRYLALQQVLAQNKKLQRFQGRYKSALASERGDVPGWVLVVLMTTGLVTAIWTIAAPRLTSILKNSLDAMNGIR